MKNNAGALKISAILSGVVAAIMTMLIFAIVFAVVSFVSACEESDWILSISNYLSILIGAGYCGSKLKQRLWLNGAIVGGIYLLALTLLRGDFTLILQWSWLKQLLLVGGVGMVGALIGGLVQQ